MGFFDSIKDSISGSFDKRREEREYMEGLRRDAEAERRLIFEQEFKKGALEVARARAKKEAAQASGLQRLRATSRARNLSQSNPSPGSFFEKMREYTLKNKANRDRNLENTKVMREEAAKLQQERMQQRRSPSANPPQAMRPKAFGRN